jgi:hypothetical protein
VKHNFNFYDSIVIPIERWDALSDEEKNEKYFT